MTWSPFSRGVRSQMDQPSASLAVFQPNQAISCVVVAPRSASLVAAALRRPCCVVTADALHCHRGMAKAIVGRGGDYVLAVKNNQPGLLRDAKAAISAAERKKTKQATTNDADHGRKETRTAIVTSVKDMAEKHEFPGLKAVARIT
jgi:predicted transposase YbfD/YdcC